jgi:transcriptional regulator with XRE-family HTH domain
MKRETFSEEIDLSTKEAAEIEKGRAFPRPETIEKIARALKVPLKELFDFEESRYFPPPPPLPTVEARRVVRRPRRKDA